MMKIVREEYIGYATMHDPSKGSRFLEKVIIADELYSIFHTSMWKQWHPITANVCPIQVRNALDSTWHIVEDFTVVRYVDGVSNELYFFRFRTADMIEGKPLSKDRPVIVYPMKVFEPDVYRAESAFNDLNAFWSLRTQLYRVSEAAILRNATITIAPTIM